LLSGGTDSPAYRVSCAVTISGGADAALVGQALGRVVRRHEILRTEFAGLEGMALPLQGIHETGPVEIEIHDLSQHGVVDWQAAIDSAFMAGRDCVCSYDRGPTLRAKLLKWSSDEQTVIISLPAMYSDSAGLRNLARELSGYLNGISKGSPSDEL